VPKINEKLGNSQLVETQQMRCPSCGRFIGYQAIVWGLVKIKCPNCKEWVTIDIRPDHNI
jgi:phage FluMu protein Com